MSKKIFPGAKLRRFREQQRMTQNELAVSLGISASYLNQIENNQRPLSASVLLKLNSAFNLDLRTFSDDEDDRLAAELRDALAHPLFQGAGIDLVELKEAVRASPNLARQFLTLYRAYQENHDDYRLLAERLGGAERVFLGGPQFPHEEVRDFFYFRSNYVDELDRAAERLQAEQGLRVGDMESGLIDYLRDRHQVTTVLLPAAEAAQVVRRYNPKTRSLALSERLKPGRRAFHLGHQICLLEYGELLDKIVAGSKFANPEAAAICRLGLANYFAGALLMPYEIFLDEAKRMRYDIQRLEADFGLTFEPICHRLSTMQRPGAKGVPFYFIRVDMAGNISKRQSAPGFHLARTGGACPLWNVHDAFSLPGKILTQLAQMPDGKTYFCIARTVTKGGGGYLTPQRRFAVGLGCDVTYAHELIYSTGMDLNNLAAATLIGPGCRICERQHCAQRAFPPIGRQVLIDEDSRSFEPYLFK